MKTFKEYVRMTRGFAIGGVVNSGIPPFIESGKTLSILPIILFFKYFSNLGDVNHL